MDFITVIAYVLPGIHEFGKTSIVYKVKLAEVDTILPATGERITFLLSLCYDHICVYNMIWMYICIYSYETMNLVKNFTGPDGH